MTKVYIVLAKGKDWTNAEAFLEPEDAQAYLAVELEEPGASGQIKTVEWENLPS